MYVWKLLLCIHALFAGVWLLLMLTPAQLQ
jgi:hypothetical protein